MGNPSLEPVLFVLWHPDCQEGAMLAEQIYSWFRPGSGLGPKVVFRSVMDWAQNVDLLLPLAPNQSAMVIVLIDENMVIDARWRRWLDTLVQQVGSWTDDPKLLLLPVALNNSALGFPPLRHLNFIRPAPAPREAEPVLFVHQAWLTNERVRSLIRQLTDALCRAMGASNEKTRIFISHAKEDPSRPGAGGTVPARAIRDYIRSETQLEAFYDENDLPFAQDFAEDLHESLADADAMIAVQTERYASRPWCRYEFSSFRRPVRLHRRSNLFGLRPTLVVEAMAAMHHSRCIPEFGNSPLIGWDADRPRESAELAVITALRNLFLTHVHRRQMAGMPDIGGSASVLKLSWLPDLSTLSHRNLGDLNAQVVVHPGNTMSSIESNILRAHRWREVNFIGMADYDPATAIAGWQAPWPRGVAWSMSLEGSDEILCKGMGRQHIEEMVGRVTGLMLRRGCTLYYGGNWTDWDGSKGASTDRHAPYRNMLHMLLQSSASEQRWPEHSSSAASQAQSSNNGDWGASPPVINHLAWPHQVERRRQADWVNLCEVVPLSLEASGLPKSAKTDDAMYRAIAMSVMRRRQLDAAFNQVRAKVPAVSARIAMHGKLRGYSGFAPGLLEECMLSWRAGHCLWLLGGFGGMTKWIVDFLLWHAGEPAYLRDAPSASDWLRTQHPPLRDLEHRLARSLFNSTTDQSGAFQTWPLWSLDDLMAHLSDCRQVVQSVGLAQALRTGLTDADTQILMQTSDPDTVVRLLNLSLTNLAASGHG